MVSTIFVLMTVEKKEILVFTNFMVKAILLYKCKCKTNLFIAPV
jgi:hypothetical protein